MKPELENKLTEKYKEFFKHLEDYNTPMMDPDAPIGEAIDKLLKQESLVVPMQFGFECGDGWYWLLENLMSQIQIEIKHENDRRDREPLKKWMDKLSFKLRVRTKHKRKLLKWLGNWIYENQPRGVPHITFQINQIKEKFGGLRFYYSGGNNAIDGMTNLAESMSYSICEFCGTTENVGLTAGWYTTICKPCYDKNKITLKWKLIDE